MTNFIKKIEKPSIRTGLGKFLSDIKHNHRVNSTLEINWGVVLFKNIPEIKIKISHIRRKYDNRSDYIQHFSFPEEIIISEKNGERTIGSQVRFNIVIENELPFGEYFIHATGTYFENESFNFSQKLCLYNK